MQTYQSDKTFLFRICSILFLIAAIWTGTKLYLYYTGPQFKVDTYIKHLARKDYNKIYEMFNHEDIPKSYSKEQIVAYYTQSYDKENILIKVSKKGKMRIKDGEIPIAFCNILYSYTNEEKIFPVYVEKINNKWTMKMPFQIADIKIHAPIGSKVYINNHQVSHYEDKMYVQKNVLPGQYKIQISFPNQLYSDYNKIIEVPKETEVFLPYDTLSIEVATIKNMYVKLGDIQKQSGEGIVTFDNVLAGRYKLKIWNDNNLIEPIEMDIGINKDVRLFNIFDFSLSKEGKSQLNQFIKGFYEEYLEDIKTKSYTRISKYFDATNNVNLIKDFKAWFIDNKDIQGIKLHIKPSQASMDKSGFLHMQILETIEMTNKEKDEYENNVIDRSYRIVLEWDTIIDISSENWVIADRKINQSIVAYKDLEGRWVQY